MFEALTDRLNGVFSGLKGRGKLTESDIDKAMRAIRLSLLEADVSLPVVKQLTTAISARAKGEEVMASLTPDQQVVKIVDEEPAAAEQLAVHGGQIEVPVHREDGTDPVAIARNGIDEAARTARDVVIVDTAGRTTLDEAMMNELVRIRDAVQPTSVLLVLDAMTGQTAVDVAKVFSDAVDFDGVVLTKLDGDARGGAALSVRAVTGTPIMFIGTGEKLEALEPFHPDRMASRILGMGDVLSLIEKAQQSVGETDTKHLEERIKAGSLTLEDFLDQMRQVRRMGPIGQLLGMVPGLRNATKGKDLEVDEGRLNRIEAIIQSMTPDERRRPETINGSRRRRIATGSGTSVQEVNQLLSQFKQMRKVMKQIGRGRIPQGLGV
jgi:signal recognition particle subunit SRP54